MQQLTSEQIMSYLPIKMEEYFLKKLVDETRDVVRIKICEFLKFCLICPSDIPEKRGSIPFTNEIDEIWHLWILQTKQYQELMNSLPQKSFIHHSATAYDHIEKTIESQKEQINLWVSYLVSYVHNFGDFTEDTMRFWHIATNLCAQFDNDIKKLNHFLHEMANNSVHSVESEMES